MQKISFYPVFRPILFGRYKIKVKCPLKSLPSGDQVLANLIINNLITYLFKMVILDLALFFPKF